MYRLVAEGTVEERIVQRAEQKLLLDAMVVQKVRVSMHADVLLPSLFVIEKVELPLVYLSRVRRA